MKKKWPWYRRNPEKALFGMQDLTPEQRGVYNTIIDLLYLRNGDLEFAADSFLARRNNCDIRTYRRIKAQLISLGKIWEQDGKLRSKGLSYGLSYRLSYSPMSDDESKDNNYLGIDEATESKSTKRKDSSCGRQPGETVASTTSEFLKEIEKEDLESLLDEKVWREAKDILLPLALEPILKKYRSWIFSSKCRRPPDSVAGLNRLFLSFCKAEKGNLGNQGH